MAQDASEPATVLHGPKAIAAAKPATLGAALGTETDGGKANDEDEEGLYLIPEEAVRFLPEEWQAGIRARAEDGRRVLQTADQELTQLSRLSRSYYHVTVLKHVRDQLASYRFEPSMEAFLELDMLTTAFVSTYARLFTGGGGSGFARDALPEPLRAVHDEILELRNKRYAHVDDHHSVSDEMEIHEEDGRLSSSSGCGSAFISADRTSGQRWWTCSTRYLPREARR